jgi:hypothetical protein
MRTLLAVVILMGGMLTLNTPADAARKGKAKNIDVERIDIDTDDDDEDTRSRRTKRRNDDEPRYSREVVECERAKHADPTGTYAGFPCWAQEALSPRGGSDY